MTLLEWCALTAYLMFGYGLFRGISREVPGDKHSVLDRIAAAIAAPIWPVSVLVRGGLIIGQALMRWSKP